MHLAKPAGSLIAWSLLWALALIAMPFLFKGNTTASWIEAAIKVVVIFVFLLLNSRRSPEPTR
jgi:hypothetical protein